jgi:glycolate oxidase iron-sulfur subunit
MISIYDRCVRCGLCLPTCPTYLETMTETSGPRGRISLIRAVDEGRIDLLSPGFVHQMSECLDCRACEAVCPSGVRYGELVETMRARIEERRAPERTSKQRAERAFLVRRLFSNMGLFRTIAGLVRFAQRTGLTSLASAFGLGAAAKLAPKVPDRFFVAADQVYETPGSNGTAFLHAGCVMHVLFPQVHEASIRMLGRARLRVVVPRAQGCCGAVAIHAGEVELARELARRSIEAFEQSGADVYVVNAAGCGSTLKECPLLFAEDSKWHERARAFSSRVRDVTEVLDAVELEDPSGRIDAVVTYQEPCHLVHAQRVSGAPRRLLRKIPGLRLVEMDESAVCCGSAGIYNLTEPEMAQRLQRRKVGHIRATGASIVATANPGCALQVASGLRDAGLEPQVRHIVELLDEAYNAPLSRASSASASSSV